MAQTQAQKDAAKRAAQAQRDPETVETAPEMTEAEARAVRTGAEPGGTTAEPETQEQTEAELEAREAARATPDTTEAPPAGTPGPRTTTLDDDVSMPSFVAPGDGPHDTVVAQEHASSVLADKGSAGQQGFGVVNAVVPIPDPSGRTQAVARAAEAAEEKTARTEVYETPSPSGKMVKVEHNLDTGATKVLGEA